MSWERDDSGLTLADIEKKQPYKFVAHHFAKVNVIPWLRCKQCGLLTLRNDLTAWATKMGCNSDDHPDFRSRCRNAKPRER